MWDLLKYYRLSDATFYDPSNNIYKFIKICLGWKNVYFEGYEAFKQKFCDSQIVIITKFVVVSSVGLKRAVCTGFLRLQLLQRFFCIFLQGSDSTT